MKPSKTVINGVHGTCVETLGVVTLPCTYSDCTTMVDFEVLDGAKEINLLGRYDCDRLGLVQRVHNTSCEESCTDILGKYKDVVGDAIGCMPGEYTIRVDTSMQPVIHAPRPVPARIRDQVLKELNNL